MVERRGKTERGEEEGRKEGRAEYVLDLQDTQDLVSPYISHRS